MMDATTDWDGWARCFDPGVVPVEQALAALTERKALSEAYDVARFAHVTGWCRPRWRSLGGRVTDAIMGP